MIVMLYTLRIPFVEINVARNARYTCGVERIVLYTIPLREEVDTKEVCSLSEEWSSDE